MVFLKKIIVKTTVKIGEIYLIVTAEPTDIYLTEKKKHSIAKAPTTPLIVKINLSLPKNGIFLYLSIHDVISNVVIDLKKTN